jgi:hypothetical protein
MHERIFDVHEFCSCAANGTLVAHYRFWRAVAWSDVETILQVEALTSVRTQLPYEYYILPFCHQGVNMESQEGGCLVLICVNVCV